MALKEEKGSVERKWPVFEKRPVQFPPRSPRSCAKTTAPRLLSQPYHDVEVRRGKEVSEAKVILGPMFDNRADMICKVPARERLVNWHPPECHFYKNETGCKAGDKCL